MFNDEMEYILDGLRDINFNIRRSSLLEFAHKLTNNTSGPEFLSKIKVHGFVQQVVCGILLVDEDLVLFFKPK